jgi:TonB-linked SusC/RagA family outer membrane protein
MPKNLIKVLACGMLAAGGTFTVQAQSTIAANQQVSACTGTVVDSEGEPIIGASVLVVGTSSGTATDFDGNFSIPNVKAGSTLRITSVGFTAVDVKWNGTPLNIVLKEDAKLLDEVVAIGYGTQKKADLTGAVGVVNVNDAKKLPQTDIASMLQGQVPGVSVQTSSQPGATANVRIRGISSFNNVGPLYVIDGLIVNDASNISPNEIESMQVLKDASAAAIYGARGANGVILITTKHGKSGKPTLDITANYSWQQMPSKIEMMDANQYMKYNELGYINAQIEWPAAANGVVPGYMLANTDWQKAVFQTGFTQDYNLMYTQGSENIHNAIGGGFLDQEGVIDGPKYKRATFRVNTDATYGILTIGENATFYYTEANPWQGGSFAGALQTPAVTPVYDESNVGGYGHGSSMFPHYITNPVGNQAAVDARNTSYRLVGNIFAELKFLKHFTYKFNMGLDAAWNRNKSLRHYWSLRTNDDTSHKDLLSEATSNRSTFLIENTLTYNQSFDRHNITALVGFTAEDVNWHSLGASIYDQQYDGLAQITLGTTQNNMSGSDEQRRMASWLARVDYNYDSRYYLQVNFRSDACSKFGLANRRGNFPSFSAGWRPTQEAFWEDLGASHIINNIKLRGSWGKIGDMQSLGNYSYQSVVSSYQPLIGLNNMWNWYGLLNDKIIPGALATTRVNPNLKWETKTTTNVGIDFELLNSRLTGSFEWFTSTTSDLLYNINTAYATGTPSLWTNYGKMRNSGIEFNILWRDMAGEFTYSVGANISTVRNKVLRLGTTDLYDAGSSRTEVGRSISDFFLIPMDGIFQSKDEVYAHTTTLKNGNVVVVQPTAEAGDIRYVDTNGDGQITQDDRVYAGSPLPKFEAGLTASLEWRGIDFSMFWTSRYGNKVYNSTRAGILATYVNSMPADYKPWTWDNPSNEDPRMYANASNNTMANTDRFLEDGSFLRLKNLQLGYSIPTNISKRFGVQRLRMYVSGQNLWTITGYKGYDPELISTNVFSQGYDSGQFPNTRQYNVGLQVTF